MIALGAISTSVVSGVITSSDNDHPKSAGFRCCKIDSEASDHIESW